MKYQSQGRTLSQRPGPVPYLGLLGPGAMVASPEFLAYPRLPPSQQRPGDPDSPHC